MSTSFPLKHHLAQRVVDRPPIIHFVNRDALEKDQIHPHPIHMDGGTPNSGLFPVDSITLNLIEKPFQINSNTKKDFENSKKFPGNDSSNKFETEKVKGEYYNKPSSVTDIQTVIAKDVGSVSDSFLLKNSLQYQFSTGSPWLSKFTKDLTERVHSPGYSDYSTLLNNGAGDGLSKIFSLLLTPGDTVLVEEFSFIPTTWAITEYGGITHPVELDFNNDGINVEKLKNLLENWETLNPNKKKPTVLYTIASGQNPTGLTQNFKNREIIYELCVKHDLMIVEDDPYCYLVLPSYESKYEFDDELTVNEYIEKFIATSYVHFDKEGRVIRSESFSKMFAPGARLGFIVAHNFFIEKLKHITQLTSKFPSGLSQTVIQSVIQYWGGIDGYLKWGIEMSKVYQHRKNLFFQEFFESSSFKSDKVSLIDPAAGMFITAKVNAPKGTVYKNLMKQLTNISTKKGIHFVCAGTGLALNEEVSKTKGNLLRISIVYLTNDDEQLIEAVKRFNETIEEVFETNHW